jgi:hypothetical protein
VIGKIVLTMLVAAAKINQSSIVPAFDQTRVPRIIQVPSATDSEASISVVSEACAVSAIIMPFIITIAHPLLFKGSMSWILITTITIGFFVGLATSLGCL